MSKSALDAGIPVLTEVIDIPATNPDAAPPPAPSPATLRATVQEVTPTVVDVPTIDGWLNEEWNRLERKIGGRILHQVMERLESDIEDRVRDALADVLQMAVETLASDIKQNLQATLHDVITQAVREEISHMQYSKK